MSLSLITMDTRLQHPFTCLVSGPSQSGKTYFVQKLIEQLPQHVATPIHDIIWCYGEWQPCYESMKRQGVRFVHGPIDSEDLSPDITHLVILDDLMDQTDKRICQFFTRGSHHRNCSIVHIVQNLFNAGKEHRTISLNCQYMVLFKNPRDCRQVDYLANQMYPKHLKKGMIESFSEATRDPHGYLFVDLKQGTPTCLRLRSKVLDPHSMVHVPKGIKIDEQLLPTHIQSGHP